MATVSPQTGVRQTIVLNQSDIQTLYSVGKVISPPEDNYVNIFDTANLFYTYKNAVFADVDNLLAFYQVPEVGDPILVSNSLNATNILGIPQNTSITFESANPYTPIMTDSGNCSIMLKMLGADPTGGDLKSTLSVTITYDILQIASLEYLEYLEYRRKKFLKAA